MFDPDVVGLIDAATFRAMLCALGFRLSRVEIRIFNSSNRGHIVLDALRRVQRELREAGRELNLGGAGSTAAGGNMSGYFLVCIGIIHFYYRYCGLWMACVCSCHDLVF